MRDDAYGHLVFGILAVIVLFVFPIMFIGIQMNSTAETRANEYTEEFVDNVRASAYFTDKDYEAYITKMGLLGITWDIEMYHYSTKYVPNGSGSIVSYQEVYTRDDIAKVLYSDLTEDIATYDLKKGDYFEIIAYPKSQNAGASFATLFTKNDRLAFVVSHGEMIDNYKDN